MSFFKEGRASRSVRFTRSHAIVRLRRELEARAFPRFEMALIVGLTGAVGFLFSFMLMHLGLNSMALRYPLALMFAYGFFLFALWLWLRARESDFSDLLDPELIEARLPLDASSNTGSADAFDGLAQVAAESDELAVPLIALFVTIGAALASLYVVYLAPLLFAELIFDGVLAYTLFRHLRSVDQAHWLQTALRRTALPFLVTALVLCAGGALLGHSAPGARTLLEALEYKEVSRSPNR